MCACVRAAAMPTILRRFLANGAFDVAAGGVWYNAGRDLYADYSCFNVGSGQGLYKGPSGAALTSAEAVNAATTKLCIPAGFATVDTARAMFPLAQIHTAGLATSEAALNAVRDGTNGCMATIEDSAIFGAWAAAQDTGGSVSLSFGVGDTVGNHWVVNEDSTPSGRPSFDADTGNTELLRAMNSAMLTLVENGRHEALLDKYGLSDGVLKPSEATCPVPSAAGYVAYADLAPAGTLKHVLDTGVIVVGANYPYSPWIDGPVGPEGTPIFDGMKGFDYDLLDEAVQVVGRHYGRSLRVEFRYFDWCNKPGGCACECPRGRGTLASACACGAVS